MNLVEKYAYSLILLILLDHAFDQLPRHQKTKEYTQMMQSTILLNSNYFLNLNHPLIHYSVDKSVAVLVNNLD